MALRPVILCGGSGTRLWPESRKSLPKQFIKLFNEDSLLDLTFNRVKDLNNYSKPIIVTNKNLGFLVEESLNKAGIIGTKILESEPKNTTAAIYLAAKFSQSDDQLIIIPADHLISNINFFSKTIEEMFNINENKYWITFGIKPTFPSEGYGYINIKEKEEIFKSKLYKVNKFIEKPSKDKAKSMIKNGSYFWNAGIFMGNASFIINSITKYAPNIAVKCDKAFKISYIDTVKNEITFNDDIFSEIPSDSIDFAVMEKDKNILLYPYSGDWSDVGSWDTMSSIKNNISKNKNIIEIQTNDNFIRTGNRLITTIGTENLIIIDSDNATLIVKKGHSEKVKDLVNKINIKKMNQGTEHTFEKRPWGKFENLLDDKNCKVKRIEINPYKRLSLQYHNFRSEHWLIVKGEAHIHLDNKEFIMRPGESIDIPLKSHHYVENKSNKPLIIIETQLGSYFGEDDIVRLDDPYSR